MSFPLFWDPEFSSLNSGENELLKVSLLGSSSEAVIPYKLSKSTFRSPGIGTFGGFFAANKSTNWHDTWAELISLNPKAHEYEIVFPPEYFYSEIFLNQISACIKLFEVEVTTDFNQHIALNDLSFGDLSKGNRKKLRQFDEASGRILRGSSGNLEKVIDVLETSRKNLGLQLSMSKHQIRSAFLRMPKKYFHYSAVIEGTVVAAAITVELSPETLYVLYWGDIGGPSRNTSPVVALYWEIVKDARENGYSILDLGTSSVNGIVNEGLKKFKENLGAVVTSKHTVRFQRPINLA